MLSSRCYCGIWRTWRENKILLPISWLDFDNEGKLVGYPKKDQFGDIDKDCYGLKELPAIEKFGFLWVHPCTDGNKLDDLGEKLLQSLSHGIFKV